MILNIIKRTSSLLLLLIIFTACEKKEANIVAKVYKHNGDSSDYQGSFYTTKYGGLNYYVSNDDQRNELLHLKNIDSIIYLIGNEKYVAKPLIRKSFSKERNDSDFSFFIDKKTYQIVTDTVSNLHTVLLFSEKTDMEILKDKGLIKAKYVEK